MTAYALEPAESEHTVELTVGSLAALFVAPDANPFSLIDNEVLGRSGIDLLRRKYRQQWPRHNKIRRLVIHLPASEYQAANGGSGLVEQAPAAIARFCQARIEETRKGHSLEWVAVRQQLRIVVLIVLVALLMLTTSGSLGQAYPVLYSILTLLAVLAACLAIWDTLSTILFGWVAYFTDDRAFRWIGGLEVEIAPLPAVDAVTSDSVPGAD